MKGKMNAIEQIGYLFFQRQDEFLKDLKQNQFNPYAYVPPNPSSLSSYFGNGWSKITHLIPDGEFIKIAAGRDGLAVEARIYIVKNIDGGDNGRYEIRGGLIPGSGTFLSIRRGERNDMSFEAKDNQDFAHFFICHSHASMNNGIPLLRWRVVLRELPSQPGNFTEAQTT